MWGCLSCRDESKSALCKSVEVIWGLSGASLTPCACCGVTAYLHTREVASFRARENLQGCATAGSGVYHVLFMPQRPLGRTDGDT